MAKVKKKAKNPGGRPRLPQNKVRDKSLERVRCSAEELTAMEQAWRAAVDPKEVSFSQWVRERLGVA